MVHVGAVVGAVTSRIYNTFTEGSDAGSDRDWISYNILKNVIL
jgi:hypothetical protein